MSPFAIAALAFSMSVDAFVVSVGRGAALGRPRYSEALRTGAVFGIVEAATPIIGWTAGIAASSLLEAVDHWIAFGLLGAVGLHMLWAALHRSADAEPPKASLPVLIATAIGTSLDAMAVGVSLAFFDVNILVIALAIGLATFIMSSGGMLMGRLISERWGRIAEVLAGVTLIGIGVSILVHHLRG
ncbi:manganese efflux pump MntP [Xanthobacter agilis]|uniref:Putative manganese efflux pump MntP n=1 Tax=Xanthobacter agilis TaxID=47492 RepID=A0ABU0LH66_XANAG|nr:manganese efflux pump MntP family protein [Xanthobacter agilis]MDQ0506478.1 putative Mn2+ efflux pump MntP [Xanthobacter agilis]